VWTIRYKCASWSNSRLLWECRVCGRANYLIGSRPDGLALERIEDLLATNLSRKCAEEFGTPTRWQLRRRPSGRFSRLAISSSAQFRVSYAYHNTQHRLCSWACGFNYRKLVHRLVPSGQIHETTQRTANSFSATGPRRPNNRRARRSHKASDPYFVKTETPPLTLQP
jgi:hypothetical protein